jgi:tight adherence protein C
VLDVDWHSCDAQTREYENLIAMESLFDIIDFLVRDPFTLLLAVTVAALLGVASMGGQWVLARADVKRRTARLTAPVGASEAATNSDQTSQDGIKKLTQSIDRLFGEANDSAKKILRKKLIQAGYYSPSAPATFLAIRFGGLILLGAIGFGIGLALDDQLQQAYIKMVGGAGLGYMLPQILLDGMINKRKDEHRSGFPDFLDLMIVCSEAGLSMEASINRVCQEMSVAYPSLSANLYFATLEVRAGRTTNDALHNLAERLAIDEAKTFATLLQQSAELGSSLVDSLKVYSDEMRNKRMMRAEEKANSLPTKMIVPMMIFIFPILFIIILFPAYLNVIETWR